MYDFIKSKIMWIEAATMVTMGLVLAFDSGCDGGPSQSDIDNGMRQVCSTDAVDISNKVAASLDSSACMQGYATKTNSAVLCGAVSGSAAWVCTSCSKEPAAPNCARGASISVSTSVTIPIYGVETSVKVSADLSYAVTASYLNSTLVTTAGANGVQPGFSYYSSIVTGSITQSSGASGSITVGKQTFSVESSVKCAANATETKANIASVAAGVCGANCPDAGVPEAGLVEADAQSTVAAPQETSEQWVPEKAAYCYTTAQ